MSDTPITPSVGAVTLAGVALSLGLTIAPRQGGIALAGVGPTITAASAVAPAHEGLPLSWSGLTAGAAGAASPAMLFRQARLSVSGVTGSLGAVPIQVSPDASTWTTVAVCNDLVSAPVPMTSLAGMRVTPLPNATLVISITDTSAGALRYIRPLVLNGDGTTSISVVGNISAAGAV